MGSLFAFNQEEYPFHLFGLPHIVMISLTIVILVWMYFFRDRIRTNYKRPLRYSLIATLIFCEASFHVWFLLYHQWSIQQNLPLQLCSISLYLCAIMLFTKNYLLFEISFFVSMSGALMAIITPELFYGFPHMRFFEFFIVHMAIIIACFYMLWIEQYRPTYRSVIKAFVTLNAIALFVFIINKLIDSNYMFLAHKPSTASLIDYLGPYPWYILSLEGVAIVIFSIIYLLLLVGHKMKSP